MVDLSAPSDADVDQPLTSAFAVQQVWAHLNRLKTRRLLVMLDTCFSGAFADDGRSYSHGGRVRIGESDGRPSYEWKATGRAVISAMRPERSRPRKPQARPRQLHQIDPLGDGPWRRPR